jgi:hypothetical protein
MKSIGTINIPQEAFIQVLKTEQTSTREINHAVTKISCFAWAKS